MLDLNKVKISQIWATRQKKFWTVAPGTQTLLGLKPTCTKLHPLYSLSRDKHRVCSFFARPYTDIGYKAIKHSKISFEP